MKRLDERLKKYGFVIASNYRVRVVNSLLQSPKTPKQISKQVGIHLSHVSKTLSELAGEGIVDCVNPNMKKGRVYRLTELGKWVAHRILSRQDQLETS
ncbi:MAG: ArsR family transcriptional regulator [Candidatus Methanomethylicaceae archaeon]